MRQNLANFCELETTFLVGEGAIVHCVGGRAPRTVGVGGHKQILMGWAGLGGSVFSPCLPDKLAIFNVDIGNIDGFLKCTTALSNNCICSFSD